MERTFFLGADTAAGFYPLTKEMLVPHDDIRLFPIQGGPGTGKSTVMKHIMREAEKRKLPFECIRCSADPSSVDAVLLPSLGAAVCDATPPHPIALPFPGLCGRTVDVGVCLDREKLARNREKILPLIRENSRLHMSAVRFLSAASRLQEEARRLLLPYADTERIFRTAARLSALLPETDKNKPGAVTRRFLSALTPDGCMYFSDSLMRMCPKIIAVEDTFSTVAPLLLQTILEEIRKRNSDCIVCPCILRPDGLPEHILLPGQGLAFVTANTWHPAPDKSLRILSERRFLRENPYAVHRNRLHFYAGAERELLDGATEKLQQAKKNHDEIEKYYVDAMDFDHLQAIEQALITEIFG